MALTTTTSRDQAVRARSYAEEIEFGIARLTVVLTGPRMWRMLLAATSSACQALDRGCG